MVGRLFSKISTYGTLPDGRVIECHKSFPEGADYKVYREMDRGVMKAFGIHNSRTEGTMI